MLRRPRSQPAFGWIRLGVTVLLTVHVFLSAWLVVTAEGVYTQGKPAPTEAHSLIAIDKDQTAIDVRIEKATSFLLYSLARDGDAAVVVNGSDATTNTTSQEQPSENAQESNTAETPREWLALGRQAVTVSLVLMVLSEAFMFTMFRWRHHLRTAFFVMMLASFAVVFPASYMMELADDGSEDENDATATNTPGANLETVSFVHTNSSSAFHVVWLGVQLEADFSGYDLGLVEPENRSDVAANVPLTGSEDASSYIAFESTFNIELGKNLDALLVLPAMWFFLPAAPSASASESEEE